jgi:hypothetical protein
MSTSNHAVPPPPSVVSARAWGGIRGTGAAAERRGWQTRTLLALTVAGFLFASPTTNGGQPQVGLESWLRSGLHDGDLCSEVGTFEMGSGIKSRELSVIVSSITNDTARPVGNCRFLNPDARLRSGKPDRRPIKATSEQPGRFVVTVISTWDEHLTCANGKLSIRRTLSDANLLVTAKHCEDKAIAVPSDVLEVSVALQCAPQ